MRGPKLLKYINSLTNPYRISIIFTFHSNSSNVRSMVAGRGVCQMITLDHKGGGGFWRGPKSDHTILEEPLQMFPFSTSSILVQNLAESSWYKIGESRVEPVTDFAIATWEEYGHSFAKNERTNQTATNGTLSYTSVILKTVFTHIWLTVLVQHKPEPEQFAPALYRVSIRVFLKNRNCSKTFSQVLNGLHYVLGTTGNNFTRFWPFLSCGHHIESKNSPMAYFPLYFWEISL